MTSVAHRPARPARPPAARAPPRADRLLLPHARLGPSTPTTRCRRRWCGPGAGSPTSRADRRCARGSTGSPPTSASTSCPAGSGGHFRWTCPARRGRRSSTRSRPGGPARRGSSRSSTGRSCPRTTTPPSGPSPKESIRLAFVAALQHLPPRQRAVLILREVLRWKADEVAQLLDSTVASVNSALQRARATLAGLDGVPEPRSLDDDDRELLAQYVDAFERYDIDALVRLLRDDATQHMPPFEMWLRGADDIATWMLGPGAACRGSRVQAMEANGSPAVAQWRPRADGGYEPWALHVLEVADGRVGAHLQLSQPRHRPVPAARPASEPGGACPGPMSSTRRAGRTCITDREERPCSPTAPPSAASP